MRKSVSMGLVAGVLGMGLANAEIKVDDKLSLTGFIDMSAGANFPDGGAAGYGAGFDQFELDFLYKFTDKLSAQVDLNYFGGEFGLEQGFITYAATDKLSLYAGKFLSSSGWEAAEPTGLYQYSYSKNCDGPAGCVYGGYQNGVAVSYAVSPMISLYGAAVASVWNGSDTDIKTPGFEAQVTLTPIEGLTIKAAYLYEKELSATATTYTVVGTAVVPTETETDGTDQSLVNVWASYSTGPVTVAAEFNYLMDWGATDDNGIGYLAMVNYALTDKFGITGRYSALKLDAPGAVTDNEIAVSPGYAITDDWFVLAEVKYELELKNTSLAVESLITF